MRERISWLLVIAGLGLAVSCRTSEHSDASTERNTTPSSASSPEVPVVAAAKPVEVTVKPAVVENRPVDAPAPTARDQVQASGDVRQVGEDKWDNGKLKVREEMKLDQDGEWILDGKVEHFWEDGSKKLEMFYVDGVPNGPKTAWFPNGKVYHTGAFVDGREDGVWITYFADGSKQAELHMNKGAFDGDEIRWHQNGKKAMYGRWVKGKQTGYFTFWDEEGKILRETDYGAAPAEAAENKK